MSKKDKKLAEQSFAHSNVQATARGWVQQLIISVGGILLVGAFFVYLGEAGKPLKTKIVLDLETVQDIDGSLQALTSEVSMAVDQLIPGQVPSYSAADIVCFAAPDAWEHSVHPAPVTLVAEKMPGEPQATHSHTVRIAVTKRALQEKPMFVFQLAHEIAHVKMDAHYDNYIIETFAVAVSIKILNDLRFNTYRSQAIHLYTHSLSQEVQNAITQQDWQRAKASWQHKIPNQKVGPFGTWDFSFAMLGALILESAQQPVWANLLGAAEISDKCFVPNGKAATEADVAEFKTCSPALSRMDKLGPALKALGYSQ